jgi:hypothetical protein
LPGLNPSWDTGLLIWIFHGLPRPFQAMPG